MTGWSRRRRALPALLGLVLLAAAGVRGYVAWHDDGSATACGDERSVQASSVPGVWAPLARATAGDPQLRRLVAAAHGWGLGTPIRAVGFDYGQWLTLGGLPDGGVVAWTKRDPIASFLSPNASVRWGLSQARVHHAWDAGGGHFLQLELSRTQPLRITAYDEADGTRDWCARVGARPTSDQGRYGTAVLPDGDVLVEAEGPGQTVTVTRLDGRDGQARWTRRLGGVDQGDYLGDLGGGLALIGGRASYAFGGAGPTPPRGSSLRAVDEATGRVRWSYGRPGLEAHVVGVATTGVVLEEVDERGSALVLLGEDGRVRWRHSAAGLGVDLTVATAGGRSIVVANTGRGLRGLDAATGRTRWDRRIPTTPQPFPYGFVLAAQPQLAPGRLLLGGTSSLDQLDVTTGAVRRFALPTDGINTTYWPYEVIATDRLLAVVTNSGAVLLRRPRT